MKVGVFSAHRGYEAGRARSGSAAALEHSLRRHERTAEAVRSALESLGHAAVDVPVDADLMARLGRGGIDAVFNTYFGPGRRQDQAHVASWMEYAGVPFTGGGAACHFLGLSKPLSKRIFASCGIPTPRFGVCAAPYAEAPADVLGLSYPRIVKTSAEGEGLGMDARSVVRSPDGMDAAVRRVLESFGQAAIVEEYVEGREFTVGILEGGGCLALPIMEFLLGGYEIYSYEAKVGEDVKESCPAPLSARAAALLEDLAVRAGRSLGCRGYWRVDFRVDAAGNPFVLEVNTLPGLQPGYSDFPKLLQKAGIGYGEAVRRILASAGA